MTFVQKTCAYLLLTSLQRCVFVTLSSFFLFAVRMSSYLMCSSLRRDGFSISIGKFQMNAKSFALSHECFLLSHKAESKHCKIRKRRGKKTLTRQQFYDLFKYRDFCYSNNRITRLFFLSTFIV